MALKIRRDDPAWLNGYTVGLSLRHDKEQDADFECWVFSKFRPE